MLNFQLKRSIFPVFRSVLGLTLYNRSSLIVEYRGIQTLSFEEIQVSDEKSYNLSAFFLHGLLGSARNWRSFSRSLLSVLSVSDSGTEEDWRMVLVDLRNHGMSAELKALNPPHDIPNSARDIADLVKNRGWNWPEVVIGHSMGGKVALHFLEAAARGDYGPFVSLPKQLWVLDSVPGKVTDNHGDGEVEMVIKTLQSLPSSVPSRRWVVNHMMEKGFSKALADWVGSNLKKAGDHEEWCFNLEGAIDMFESYREKCYWTLLENPPEGVEIGIVIGEESDRWDVETVGKLEHIARDSRGSVAIHRLPKAGHWVHVDNPKGLLEIFVNKLRCVS